MSVLHTTTMTGPFQAMHCLTHPHNGALTLAVNPFTWLNEYWRDLWVRGAPSTVNGQATDDIGMWIWWFCVLWFVFLMALMIAFVAKYRRKKGKIAPRSAAHNTPLEIAWTVIPTLFLVYMFFKGFASYFDKVVAPGNAVQMDLTAQKWNFALTYPNGSFTNVFTTIGAREIPVFYMPADVPIKLRMISQDVNHGFFVPDFRIKQDITHNRYTTAWFEAKAPDGSRVHPKSLADVEAAKASAESKGLRYSGPEFIKELAGKPYEDHWLFCSEYCGEEHSEMAAIIRVVAESDYNEWLNTIGIGSLPPDKLGEALYKVKGCSQCHTLDGSDNTGPTWKNMFGHAVAFTDGTSYTAEQMADQDFFANYVRESIKVPAAKIVQGKGNNMPPQTLNEQQIQGVIAFLKTISDVKAPGAAAPAPAGKPGADKPAAPATPSPAAPAGKK